MYCRRCGNELQTNAQTCERCGEPVADPSTHHKWNWLVLGGTVCTLIAVLALLFAGGEKQTKKAKIHDTHGTAQTAHSAEEGSTVPFDMEKQVDLNDIQTPVPDPESIWPPVQRPALSERHSAEWLFEKGMSYLNKNEYFNGLAYVGMAANEGNYSAQYRLYLTYNNGDGGMPQEDIVAAYWRQASKLQHADPDDPMGGKGMLNEEVFTAEYDRSAIYFKDGEYPSAIAYLGILANEGDVSAQYMLGQCYMEGVTKDRYPQFSVRYEATRAAGIYWLERAAEQGHCCAQGYLGYCYRTGRGVEQDLATAFAWDRLSARQRCPFGLIHIGYFYADPKDDLLFVEKNYYIAKMFYDASDEANHCYAENRLNQLEKLMAKSLAVKGKYVDELDVRSAELERTDPQELQRMQSRSNGVTIDMIVKGGNE